jgi:CheY-like chemotaxis protein
MVYLVDDDRDDLELVHEALASNSFYGPVDDVYNGLELLQRLSEVNSRPDLIVMDLNMPLLDGFQALHRIKSNPRLNRIPVIIFTASTSKDDEQRCLALGCDSYFVKPNNLEDYDRLVEAIKSVMGTSGIA